MDEARYGAQDQDQSLPPSDLGDRGADQSDSVSTNADGRSEQRLTTSDLADRAGERSDEESPAGGTDNRALFAEDEASSLRERWREVQTAFVDEPRRAVEDADALVADLMQKLAETFARERSSLEGQWDRSGDVSTEEMRVALQRYRSFFDRLLSA